MALVLKTSELRESSLVRSTRTHSALMPYKDKARQLEYQRKWMENRRNDYMHDKCCVECGSVDDLEVHHIEPDKKVSHRVWSWSYERRMAELDKCIVLCIKCHGVKHRFRPCGTMVAYRRGCRCDDCCRARGAYAALERKAAKLGQTPATMK